MKGFDGRMGKSWEARLIAGVDEAGRGPLAGPVIAAAVILPEGFSETGINDSKKLTEKQRERLYGIITEQAAAVSIGIKDNNTIDEINILNATKLAMRDAVNNLSIKPELVLVDAVSIPDLDIRQTGIIKGDEASLSIAAASIIAKVTRDRIMAEYDAVYPGYAFASNKGYGTKAHYEGLDAHGPCPIHRRSFLTKYLSHRENGHFK